MERRIVYFDSPGKQNTDEVIRIAKERIREGGCQRIWRKCCEGAQGVLEA